MNIPMLLALVAVNLISMVTSIYMITVVIRDYRKQRNHWSFLFIAQFVSVILISGSMGHTSLARIQEILITQNAGVS